MPKRKASVEQEKDLSEVLEQSTWHDLGLGSVGHWPHAHPTHADLFEHLLNKVDWAARRRHFRQAVGAGPVTAHTRTPPG